MNDCFEEWDWKELQLLRDLYRKMLHGQSPTVPKALLVRIEALERKYTDTINNIVESWEAMTRESNVGIGQIRMKPLKFNGPPDTEIKVTRINFDLPRVPALRRMTFEYYATKVLMDYLEGRE